ncbi:MAG TPA: TMEM175 family protein [Candidatus Tumulicola sp.]|jgi:uncharacterized membrane protein
MIAKGSAVGADAERTLHRLEAFSDIVIGFCIAEMGINLLIPQRSADFRAIATSVIGFAISFFLISIVWWVHQRIFRTFFILTPVTLVVNFTLLGSLVLMVYMQQLVLHFIGHGGRQVVDLMRMWMTSYGLVYGLLDAMLWIGLRERWKTLSDADLRWGIVRASILSIGALMFFLIGSGLAGYRSGVVLIVGPIAVFGLRFALPKIVDRIIATRS